MTLIAIYIKEAQAEEKTALMLRTTNNTTDAFMAEHKALKYRRKVNELKKIMFSPKLFLMRSIVPNRRFLSKGKFQLFFNIDNHAMLMNYSAEKLESDKVESQPVIVILKEVFPKFYVTVSENSEQ